MNVDQTIGLARVAAHQAGRAIDPVEQARFLQQADRYYALAVTLRPRDGSLQNEWVALKTQFAAPPQPASP